VFGGGRGLNQPKPWTRRLEDLRCKPKQKEASEGWTRKLNVDKAVHGDVDYLALPDHLDTTGNNNKEGTILGSQAGVPATRESQSEFGSIQKNRLDWPGDRDKTWIGWSPNEGEPDQFFLLNFVESRSERRYYLGNNERAMGLDWPEGKP